MSARSRRSAFRSHARKRGVKLSGGVAIVVSASLIVATFGTGSAAMAAEVTPTVDEVVTAPHEPCIVLPIGSASPSASA